MEQPLSQQVATRARSLDAWSFAAWLPNPDPVLKALGKDIQVYRDLRADAHIGGALRRRRAAVKSLERGLTRNSAPSRVFTNLQSILADIDLSRMITESMDACLYGYQPMEVTWGKVGSFIVPTDVSSKPPEWFTFGSENQLRFRSRQSPLYGEELPERKFILPRQDATYDNPYGFPDLSMVFWPTAFKKGGLKFWVTFSEKYGMPFVVGKQPRHATPTETNDLLDKLENMVQDAVAVIPDDDSIDIIAAGSASGSADNFERLLMFCRAEVSTALLGGNQSTESNSTNASAQAGLSVAAEIRDGDAGIAAGAVNDLLKWICDINFGNTPRPVYELWDQEAVDAMQAGRDERLSNAGARLSNQYFANAYDLKPGDLLDQVPVAAPMPMPAADFAEADPKLFPDQAALDKALAGESLQDHADGLLSPLIASIQDANNEQEALGMLADAYPDMDEAALTKALTRLLFAAAVVGKLSAQSELA